MQPPPVNAIATAPAKTMRSETPLDDLFPDGAWQVGVCKQLLTADGMLLFQDWEQTSEDRWKFWPITVIIGRGMSGDKFSEPVIIEANEGAEIRFTESLDVMSGGAPPIRRGKISGDVRIYRTSSDADQSLDIRTSNVGIDNRRIWTTESLQMQVGQAQLDGRDLTIHLAAPAEAKGQNRSAVLDRMGANLP